MSQISDPNPASLPLYLAYQPVVNITHTEPHVAAYECLLRVGPNTQGQTHNSVLEAAERNGSIENLDLWIAEKAAYDASLNPEMRIWLNLSQTTLSSAPSIRQITQLFYARAVSSQMRIEMTETLNGCERRIIENLKWLKRMSIGVVIDDIHEGYSKAHLLQTDLVSGCKLSRNSTVQLACSQKHFDDTARMVDWCKDNEKTVVMEGIETESEMDIALRLGVDFCQGFYFWPALELTNLPLFGESVAIPKSSSQRLLYVPDRAAE